MQDRVKGRVKEVERMGGGGCDEWGGRGSSCFKDIRNEVREEMKRERK